MMNTIVVDRGILEAAKAEGKAMPEAVGEIVRYLLALDQQDHDEGDSGAFVVTPEKGHLVIWIGFSPDPSMIPEAFERAVQPDPGQ